MELSPKGYVDLLVDNTALPNGATVEDLKAFVYGTLDKLGLNMDEIDAIENARNKL